MKQCRNCTKIRIEAIKDGITITCSKTGCSLTRSLADYHYDEIEKELLKQCTEAENERKTKLR